MQSDARTAVLSACPDTCNGQPPIYAALASQRSHMAVYLTADSIASLPMVEFVDRVDQLQAAHRSRRAR